MSAGLAARVRRAVAERGVGSATRAALREIAERATSSYPYYRAFHSFRTFTFEGKRHRYFFHPYNTSWKTERVVEVPIIWEIVRQHRRRRILEVGNVLAHYFPVDHDRVDKYEKAPGVLNEDIVDYCSERTYDLVVSISTLEHVGYDEEPREPEKLLRAFENLRRLAGGTGRIVVTLPLGYNPHCDTLLRDGRIAFSRRGCLKRVSRDNRWAEVDWKEIENARLGTPFRGINGLVIGAIDPGD